MNLFDSDPNLSQCGTARHGLSLRRRLRCLQSQTVVPGREQFTPETEVLMADGSRKPLAEVISVRWMAA